MRDEVYGVPSPGEACLNGSLTGEGMRLLRNLSRHIEIVQAANEVLVAYWQGRKAHGSDAARS